MSRYSRRHEEETEEHTARPGQLSSNGQWIFGAVYAFLALIGFGFGVWAGASKPSKPVEVADARPKETSGQPKPPVIPPVTPTPPANPAPAVATNPDPAPMTPEPAKEPKKEPKPKIVEPKPPTPATPVEPKPADVKPVMFEEIKPILTGYCGNCHGLAGKPKAGIDLRTVAAIMKGGENGDILKVGDPKKSKLYTCLLDGAETPMPPDGKPKPSEKDIKLIHDWILTGAKQRGGTATAPVPKKPIGKVVSFKQVSPIFMGYCGNCHGNVGKPKGGINLFSVAAIMKGGENGDILKVGDPKKSKLYTCLAADADTPMPPNGKPGPKPNELQLIHDWILGGAKERRRSVRGRRGKRRVDLERP